MESFYELEEELGSIRIFGLVNNESMRLSIEEMPVQYRDNSKVKVVSCFIYNVDVDALKSIVEHIREEVVHGFKRVCLVLKDDCKRLFNDDYSITSKDVDCFCISPIKGYGFKVTGSDFEAFVTMNELIVNLPDKTLLCNKPEQVKPIFRSIATGSINQQYIGDIEQFRNDILASGCFPIQEIVAF